VSQIIAEIGYTPNISARNLRVQSTKMVLALVPGLVNSFFSPILSAIEDELSNAGYGLIIGDTRNENSKEAHYTRLIRARMVDGVILLTGRMPRDEDGDDIEPLVPMAVLFNAIRGSAVPAFEVANRKAGYTMTQYLIDMGHRRIAHIAGPPQAIDGKERTKGFISAMAAAGIDIADETIWPGDYLPGSGAQAARRFLALNPSDRPTAVFAASDECAIGFIKALVDAGLSVPRDVSVAGFDDIENLAFLTPALTTMRQPRAELGHLVAVDLLRRMTDAPPNPNQPKTRLDCELIVRDSVRAVGASEA
jgi:LacI family repressor for deo operon, udp, cdd, tsx, nupC, and nupG